MIFYMTPKAEWQLASLSKFYEPLKDLVTEPAPVQKGNHVMYVKTVGNFWLAGTKTDDRFTVYTIVASDGILKKASLQSFGFPYGTVDLDNRIVSAIKGLAQPIILANPKLYRDTEDLTYELTLIAEEFKETLSGLERHRAISA